MKEQTNKPTLRPARRSPWGTKPRRSPLGVGGNERGQSLILALLIMFLLVFLGGVFVALIARNVGRTQRSGETLSADYLSEAGIRYAGDQLTYSEDGADWRPVPAYPKVVEYWEDNAWRGYDWIVKNILIDLVEDTERPNLKDPDHEWLMQGFSRFTYGKGRFLLRVTYNPRPHDPMSKYVKIESVGRMGIVDPEDPTTWQTRKSSRLRAERVAYKAIGITDYSRFITNKDRRPGPFSLGAPGFEAQFGVWDDLNNNEEVDITVTPGATPDDTTVTSEVYGGSIRVNGDLLWHGINDIWVNPLRNEGVEVAGDIQFDVSPTGFVSDPQPLPVAGETVVRVNELDDRHRARRSADPYLSTFPKRWDDSEWVAGVPLDAGIYRDGWMATDANRYPRNIMRLEPPLIDARGPAGGVSRYRELTRNSGEWKLITLNGKNEWFNTGFYGWGAGIYINNRAEVQSETELGTLKNEWLTPGSSQYWVGPYYIPPGVLIILTPYDLDDDGKPDMMLIRSDATPSNPVWFDRDGNALTTTGGQMIMPYPDADSDSTNGLSGVLFAEGNIRIKGTLPPNTQLTVVSGGTIYVEGSILRYPYDKNGDLLPPSEPRDSAIALLATDNVCINTTQFFGPQAEGLLPVNWRPDLSSFIASVRLPLNLSWAFGADATRKYVDDGGNQLPVCAYTRHAAAGGDLACYMNMSINQFGYGSNENAPADPWWGLYQFGPLQLWNPAPSLPYKAYIYPLADIYAAPALSSNIPRYSQVIAEQKWPMWEHQVFTLFGDDNHQPGNLGYTFYTDPGVYNSIGFHLDQNFARADYLLSRLAIQPCDIRIEALMYAQNGCFFVIPGDWFNPDTNDIELTDLDGDGNIDNDENPSDEGGPNGIPDYRDPTMKRQRIDPRWPYYGQPLDCEITIMGAISENVPASIAEVSAWMEKWGWIPPVHGCSDQDPTLSALHRTVTYRSPLNPSDPEDQWFYNNDPAKPIKQRGLTIIYDSALSYPKTHDPSDPEDPNLDVPVRRDGYKRILPLLPKLPVSPETLYFGRPT